MGDDVRIEVGQRWCNKHWGDDEAVVVAVDAVEPWRACLRLDDGRLFINRWPLPETRELVANTEAGS